MAQLPAINDKDYDLLKKLVTNSLSISAGPAFPFPMLIDQGGTYPDQATAQSALNAAGVDCTIEIFPIENPDKTNLVVTKASGSVTVTDITTQLYGFNRTFSVFVYAKAGSLFVDYSLVFNDISVVSLVNSTLYDTVWSVVDQQEVGTPFGQLDMPPGTMVLTVPADGFYYVKAFGGQYPGGLGNPTSCAYSMTIRQTGLRVGKIGAKWGGGIVTC